MLAWNSEMTNNYIRKRYRGVVLENTKRKMSMSRLCKIVDCNPKAIVKFVNENFQGRRNKEIRDYYKKEYEVSKEKHRQRRERQNRNLFIEYPD